MIHVMIEITNFYLFILVEKAKELEGMHIYSEWALESNW
jgi:hypothetical protein